MRQWIILSLVACGGGKGGGAGGAAAAIERNAEVSCSKSHECRSSFPTSSGLMFEDIFGNTEAECVATLTEQFEPEAVQTSVDAGRIVFDPVDADLCVDAVEQFSCAEWWSGITGEPAPTPPACDTAFVGTVPAGGTCTIDQDCADGNACFEATCMST